METIRGIIKKVLTEDKEKGKLFALVGYETPAGLVETRISAFCRDLKEGDYFVAKGEWRESPAKGRYPAQSSLFCKSIQPDLPTSKAGATLWFANLFTQAEHGATPDSVKAMVDRHGDRVAHLCEANPELLVGLSKSPNVHRGSILKTWGRAVSGRRAFKLMEDAGVTKRAMQSIHDAFLDKTYDVIRNDPYKASRVKDVGFVNVDKIGQHIKIGSTDDRRVGAAMVEVLNASRSEGSTFLRINTVGERMDAMFQISPEVAIGYIGRNMRSPDAAFVVDDRGGALVAAMRELRDGERAIAEAVGSRLANGRRNPRLKVDQVANALFATKAFEWLDETQRSAVVLAMTEPFMILTGGPGTGKSAVSEVVVAGCKKLDRGPVLLCAPTGKAAKRLEETTKEKVITIHKLLEAKEIPLTGGSTFGRNAKNPLPAGCVVLCDESSMFDIPMMSGLLDAMPPDGRVILVGDKNQLPSVDAGAVLADLLGAENDHSETVVPSVELVNVYRQGRTSAIATGAAEIRQGRLPFMSNAAMNGLVLYEHASSDILARVKYFVQKVCVETLKLKPHQFSVLSPQSQGTAGTWEINRALSQMLNPNGRPIPGVVRMPDVDDPSLPIPRVGDRVMATKNDEGKDVSNGDVGTIIDAGTKQGPNNQSRGFIKVRFDDGEKQEGGREVEFPTSAWRSLFLAYAITIHKSQGSQYHTVVMPVTMAHANMLDRSLLYTGWTRAKTLLCLVGEREALDKSVATVASSLRETRLREYLQGVVVSLGVRGAPKAATARTAAAPKAPVAQLPATPVKPEPVPVAAPVELVAPPVVVRQAIPQAPTAPSTVVPAPAAPVMAFASRPAAPGRSMRPVPAAVPIAPPAPVHVAPAAPTFARPTPVFTPPVRPPAPGRGIRARPSVSPQPQPEQDEAPTMR